PVQAGRLRARPLLVPSSSGFFLSIWLVTCWTSPPVFRHADFFRVETTTGEKKTLRGLRRWLIGLGIVVLMGAGYEGMPLIRGTPTQRMVRRLRAIADDKANLHHWFTMPEMAQEAARKLAAHPDPDQEAKLRLRLGQTYVALG